MEDDGDDYWKWYFWKLFKIFLGILIKRYVKLIMKKILSNKFGEINLEYDSYSGGGFED